MSLLLGQTSCQYWRHPIPDPVSWSRRDLQSVLPSHDKWTWGGKEAQNSVYFQKKNHFFIELTVNDCCVDFKCMVLCLSYEHELQQCNTSLYSRWTILILGNQCLNVGAEEDLLLENMFFLKRKGKSSFWQFCLVTVSFWGLTEQNYLYIVCICKLWSFKPEGHKKHECVFNPVKRL